MTTGTLTRSQIWNAVVAVEGYRSGLDSPWTPSGTNHTVQRLWLTGRTWSA